MEKKNWSYIGTVTVVDFRHRKKEYPSLKDAVFSLRKGEIDSLKYGFLLPDWLSAGDSHLFLDELDMKIPVGLVKYTYYNIPLKCWSWKKPRYYYDHDIDYRNGPVWGIRCCRGGFGYRRHPLIINETRATEAFLLEDAREYKMRVRGRRKKLLPSWEWPGRADWRSNSWKRFRMKQYKGS